MDPSRSRPCNQISCDGDSNGREQLPWRPISGPPTTAGSNRNSQPCAAILQQENDEGHRVISKEQRGWRKLIRNFTPSYVGVESNMKHFLIVVRWFSVTMGTGIVSILLHNLPYNGIWLYWISVIIFALNVLLFTLFIVISILRYTLYPRIWSVMIRHPAQSLFLGTFPMGLATIVNMIVFVCVPAWGTWAVYLVRSIPSCSRCFTNKTRPGLFGGLM
jgi:hypothetical protein